MFPAFQLSAKLDADDESFFANIWKTMQLKSQLGLERSCT